MNLNIAVYNVEWMMRWFDKDGNLKMDSELEQRAQQLASVAAAIDADIMGIVEGLDTTVSGSKLASAQFEQWAAHYNLDSSYRAVHGFPSGGQQELCVLFKSSKVDITHRPTQDQSKNPFNEPFNDTLNVLIDHSLLSRQVQVNDVTV